MNEIDFALPSGIKNTITLIESHGWRLTKVRPSGGSPEDLRCSFARGDLRRELRLIEGLDHGDQICKLGD